MKEADLEKLVEVLNLSAMYGEPFTLEDGLIMFHCPLGSERKTIGEALEILTRNIKDIYSPIFFPKE